MGKNTNLIELDKEKPVWKFLALNLPYVKFRSNADGADFYFSKGFYK
jgi:hypothetical protein